MITLTMLPTGRWRACCALHGRSYTVYADDPKTAFDEIIRLVKQ